MSFRGENNKEEDLKLKPLIFLLIREVIHLKRRHTLENILQHQKYGDIKKQVLLFQTGYTGFDALFVDYYTNSRYKIDQEIAVDLTTIRIMKQMGMPLSI